jgi:hypothetical protein
MRDQAFAEKSGDAMPGAIDELIGDEKFARGKLLL